MTKRRKTKAYSLIQPTGMGGIYGGGGYSFQDRYIVCHIPKWISDPSFIRIMPEGTGDVDVVYLEKTKQNYEHIQVKDYLIDTSEFKQIIESFVKIDRGTNKRYRKFTIACPSVGTKVKGFLNKLSRYKDAKYLYDKDNASALNLTTVDSKKEFSKLGILKHFDFIMQKLDLEIGRIDFGDNSICKQHFISSLLEHPNYKKKIYEMLRPVYPIIFDAIIEHRGKVITRNKLESLINSGVSGIKGASKATILHIHNWTVEKFDTKPNLILDWSQHFDRQNRRLPSVKIWNSKLVPELFELRNKISKKTSSREITFRGKCALSTGIALGLAFPEIGNWNFEIVQPPQIQPWRSDAIKINGYNLKRKELNPAAFGIKPSGNDVVFIFNITGSALGEVTDYLKTNNISVRKIILIYPLAKPGNTSIQNDSEAASLASAAKNFIKEELVKNQSSRAHLFFYGPLGLAILLGQKLTSVGKIQLYEYQNPGYVPSCLLNT